DHAALQNPAFLHEHKIKAALLNTKAMTDTLNNYLKNKYGDGKLVSCFINDNVYLDHNLIAEKKLNLQEVEKTIADFLSAIDGVAAAVTAAQLQDAQYTEGPKSLVQRGFYKKRSGDVIAILD